MLSGSLFQRGTSENKWLSIIQRTVVCVDAPFCVKVSSTFKESEPYMSTNVLVYECIYDRKKSIFG